ncbi:hypothetical protein KPH14_002490 [Odynerus spinipes]|uniref:Uncharacterized protein n=1 Tax=Odynerus spinipes TaxID=1348599 RepID=A0AAD9RS80_9HYME|nr:hypothetical protein KPH14_002490 [Odynerus spinipes]
MLDDLRQITANAVNAKEMKLHVPNSFGTMIAVTTGDVADKTFVQLGRKIIREGLAAIGTLMILRSSRYPVKLCVGLLLDLVTSLARLLVPRCPRVPPQEEPAD